MSFRASKWAIAQRAGSGPAKTVLLILADASGDDGCFLSHGTIADRAEISERCAWQQVKALEAAGLISRSARRDARGHRSSDLITLKMDAQPAGGADRANPQDVREGEALTAPHDIPNRTSRQSLTAGGAEEPVLEPVIEPVREVASLPAEPNPSVIDIESRRAKRQSPTQTIPAACPCDRDIIRAQDRLNEAGLILDAQVVAAKFRGHSLAKGTRWRDWSQAFRNWVENEIRFASERASASGSANRRAAHGWSPIAQAVAGFDGLGGDE